MARNLFNEEVDSASVYESEYEMNDKHLTDEDFDDCVIEDELPDLFCLKASSKSSIESGYGY